MASFIVPICDKEEDDVFIKRFEAHSMTEVEDKVMDYVQDEWDWDEDVKFPYDYNNFKQEMINHNIVIGDIIDLDLI